MEAYEVLAPGGAFERSRIRFEVIVSGLADPVTGAVTHAELEERITEEGRELMRSLLQDHLDLRAVREERRDDVTDAAGAARTRIESGHVRSLTTVFGRVSVGRLAYRAPGAANLYPGDAVLNLPGAEHSHGLRRVTVLEAVRGSYDEAVAAIVSRTGVSPGKGQVLSLVAAAAVDVAAFYAARHPGPCPDTDTLVLTFDGKGVVMRPEGLRAGTAKAAVVAEHKLATRLSRGEKANRKRMAEIGAVYDATPAVRGPDDIIAGPGGGPHEERDRRPGPEAAGKWLTASVESDAKTVIAAVFDEADRRDPDRRRTWIALVDGNAHQIKRIKAEARARRVRVTIVCDFIHVLEYLWKAGWCFFAE
ncbi:ISKra4 family transposase, partial [Streptomyces vinaceus]